MAISFGYVKEKRCFCQVDLPDRTVIVHIAVSQGFARLAGHTYHYQAGMHGRFVYDDGVG